jgi:hypothetical protein
MRLDVSASSQQRCLFPRAYADSRIPNDSIPNNPYLIMLSILRRCQLSALSLFTVVLIIY